MELVKQADALQALGKPVIHLSIGEPDFPMPEPVQSALMKAIADNKTRYTAALGLPQLRHAISDYYQFAFGVQVPARQIVVTSGASAALMYACLALINQGQEVLLADPGYPCNKTFVQMAGGVPKFVQTREAENFQPDWRTLKSAWTTQTAGVLLASPNNPTGTQLNPAAMREIVEGVKANGGFTIVDEIYQSLCYDQAAQSVMQVCGIPGEETPIVVINSFSKYFGMTGLRLGWMVVPEGHIRTVERLAQNMFICPPHASQIAALAALDCIDELEANRATYAENRRLMLEGLPKAGFTRFAPPDGAFYVYADVSDLTEDSLGFAAEILDGAGVAVTPGLDFDPVRGARTLRFSYARATADIVEGLERLRAFMTGR